MEKSTVPAAITITETARNRVRSLMQEREAEDHALRLFVSGGGCSGYQYGMALDNTPRETDHRYDFGGIPVVIDPESYQFLSGATIDYVDEMMGGGFKIDNPNASSTCGCGNSFRTEADKGHKHANGGCGCH
ncbi:MAG: iron-sulfur cluster insertion protein ErpA [Anaerolineales bacterium]